MSGNPLARHPDGNGEQTAYEQGRRAGLATAALACALVAFVSLLGLEKAILAGVLAIMALRHAPPGEARAARRGRAALIVAGVYLAAFLFVVVLYHERLAALLRQLQQLS